MAATSLSSRVTSRLPFQTLAPEEASPYFESSPPVAPTAEVSTATTSLNRPRLRGVSVLLVAENIARLMQPLAMGLAINSLMIRSFSGLIVLLGQQLAYLLISSIRQRMVSQELEGIMNIEVHQMTPDMDETCLRDRTTRIHNQLHLIEQALPESIHIAVSLCGALLMLALYDWLLAPVCLVLVLPVILLSMAGGRQSQLLGRQIMQAEERESELLSGGDLRAIRQHFQRYAQTRRQLANLDASSFCLMQLFVLGLLATTLVHYCLQSSVQAGDIVAVVMYVLWFLTALNSLPVLVRLLNRLRTITP